MTPFLSREIIHEAKRRQAAGHKMMLLVLCRTASPRRWDRVRIVRGVFGRCIGELARGKYVVDVAVADVLGNHRMPHPETKP